MTMCIYISVYSAYTNYSTGGTIFSVGIFFKRVHIFLEYNLKMPDRSKLFQIPLTYPIKPISFY